MNILHVPEILSFERIPFQIVLECQTELIRGIQPGSTSIDGMYRNMQKLLGKVGYIYWASQNYWIITVQVIGSAPWSEVIFERFLVLL